MESTTYRKHICMFVCVCKWKWNIRHIVSGVEDLMVLFSTPHIHTLWRNLSQEEEEKKEEKVSSQPWKWLIEAPLSNMNG